MISLSVLLLASHAVSAGPGLFASPVLRVAQYHGERSRGISLDEAVDQVRRQTAGRVLSAETLTRDGHRVHRIKVLTGRGRVRRLQLDADSGQMIRER